MAEARTVLVIGNTTLPGVLISTDVYPPRCGGAGWSAHALALCLRDRGHQVEILEMDAQSRHDGWREYDGIRIQQVGVAAARRSLWRRLGRDDYATEAVRQAVAARLAADAQLRIVHAQHLHTGPGALRAARQAGRAAVLTVRDYWPVCLHSTTWFAGAPCPACSRRSLAACMRDQFGWPLPLAAAMRRWARGRIAARGHGAAAAHRVVAVSAALRDRLQAFGAPFAMEVVPNIVDPDRCRTEAQSPRLRAAGIPGPGEYLLFAGKLTAIKGVETLIRWLAQVPSPRPQLLLAGTGPLEEAIRHLAAREGVETQLLGWVDKPELLGWMQEAIAVVLPSRWEEPLSRVMLESLALGTPVISWPVPSSREVLVEGETGWIVDAPEGLARALRRLGEPGRRAWMAERARNLARARFAPEVVYPQIRAVYEAALREASDA